MAQLRNKGTVVIYNEHTGRMIEVAEAILGKDCTITSGRDGKHQDDSKHYIDEALDFRGRHLGESDRVEAIHDMQSQLGIGYRVLASNDGAIHTQTS